MGLGFAGGNRPYYPLKSASGKRKIPAQTCPLWSRQTNVLQSEGSANKKQSSRKCKNKFHGKFGNFAAVRIFEADTAAKRKPHHLVLSWCCRRIGRLASFSLLAYLHSEVNGCAFRSRQAASKYTHYKYTRKMLFRKGTMKLTLCFQFGQVAASSVGD